MIKLNNKTYIFKKVKKKPSQISMSNLLPGCNIGVTLLKAYLLKP